MKRIGLGLLQIVCGLMLSSCQCSTTSSSSVNDWRREEELRRIEKEKNLKELADSTVSLSFYGVELAAPYKSTVAKMKQNKNFANVRYKKGDKTSCEANVLIALPNFDEPLVADILITSYKDTITSFMIMSDDYDTRNALTKLYEDKYQEKYSKDESRADDWGDKVYRSGHWTNLWTFKNQSVRVSHFYEEKRENYVKDPNMRSPQNRYGVRYSKIFKAVVILYNDLKLCEEVERIQRAEKEKADRIRRQQAREMERQDSIKNAEKQKYAAEQI